MEQYIRTLTQKYESYEQSKIKIKAQKIIW